MTRFARSPAPHLSPTASVTKVMRLVLLALVPAFAVHTLAYGPGIIVTAAIAALTALATEYAVLRLRRRDAQRALADNSALVMAALLALALPPLCPWWVTAIAAAFAILFAKQLFGGLGFNLFNPAMAGYAAVLISFPEVMTRWPAPFGDTLGWLDSVRVVLAGTLPAGLGWDALTTATPLDALRTQMGAGAMLSEALQADHGGGRTSWLGYQIAVLAGGVLLLALKVIRWHIPAGMLAGVIATALLLRLIDSDHYAPVSFHLTSGAVMLGAFFIATDPVSAATAPRGRLIYAGLIGVLTVLIRSFGNFPDGVAFAVLLTNMCVPLIDYYTVPRAYGHGVGDDPP